ncbi:MAG TPA: hypothetical protein VGQ04_03635 [Chitinophagaceae bacterium]|jgi:hypothetical protein|nr:hypothetical protein [Chitinophagaceae bacterium]
MKKLFVFAVAFIAFTGFTFSGKNEKVASKATTYAAAKVTHDFTYFRTHPQTKKNVVLDWGIDTPAGVTCFTVERSYDGDFYDAISQVPCNNAVRFSWKDEGVFPGTIYYRIACNMNDGTTHYSAVETIRVVQR